MLNHVKFSACVFGLLLLGLHNTGTATSIERPNIVIFLADDLGYGDLMSYGHPTQEWGPIDDLAREGLRFTSMYTASSLCSPSRAALLTGRLPLRVGIYGLQMNFTPLTPTGMPPEEITLAEALRDAGYSTGMVGKWHLGINSRTPMDGAFLPYRNGFDYVGTNLPYTNLWSCDEKQIHVDKPNSLGCYLYRNATIIQQPISHENLTKQFVEDSKSFIRQHETKIDQPFFLFLSFVHPHVNMFTNEYFEGSSKRGVYGDNIREMSWAVGEVMSEIKRLGFDDNTLAYFTSDNGGHIELCNEGGDNGIFRGGKANYFEGGLRVPGIFRWPGRITPGTVSSTVVSQMDMFPTLVEMVGGTVPSDRIIDGQNILPSIPFTDVSGQQTKSIPRYPDGESRSLFFYCNDNLFAVRYGDFKFHFMSMPVKSRLEYGRDCGEAGFPNNYYFACLFCGAPCVLRHDPPLIYNLAADPGETYPLDPSLNEELLQEVNAVIELHEYTMKKGPALFTSLSIKSIPCCDTSSPRCSCNYP